MGGMTNFKNACFFLNNIKAKILVVGDSLLSNLSCYPKIWRKFINHGALNFGIAGDKAQNIL